MPCPCFSQLSTAVGRSWLARFPERSTTPPRPRQHPPPSLRVLGNKLTGILHGCLGHHRPYDETIAWAGQTHAVAA